MKKATAILVATMILTQTTSAATMYVTSENGLRIRSSPSLDGEVLEVVGYAEEVEGSLVGQWFKTSNGYAKAEHLSEENPLDAATYMGEWRITAYAETGSPCANGEYPEVGETIAHNSLPFGTKVYIEDVGIRVIEDRGPAWLGDEWCDLYLGVVWDCIVWGNQYRDVWIMEMP